MVSDELKHFLQINQSTLIRLWPTPDALQKDTLSAIKTYEPHLLLLQNALLVTVGYFTSATGRFA